MEPRSTALLLLAVGSLLVLSVLSSRVTRRTGLPVALLFLGIGIVAGQLLFGDIRFADFHLALRLGTVALVLILFDGGLNTPLAAVKRGLGPAGALATAGVLITAGVVALAARLLGLSWAESLLIGAVVSSTDAAAVFSVLRASGLQLKRRVGVTLEVESGLNDPMAVILTSALTYGVGPHGGPLGWSLLGEIVLQIGGGAIAGLVIGYTARALLTRVRLTASGLYPVLSVGVALLAFALPTLFHGSGFLAVYLAAVIVGNGQLPHRGGLLRVHDAIAWFSQVGMFLLLGLLVTPLDLLDVAWIGFGVALVLAFVARPLAAIACLAPFRYPPTEIAFVGWVGLRGAVPIILATMPVLAGIPGAQHIFNVVFFVVVVTSIVPGATIGWVTRKLGLESKTPPLPPAVLEISSVSPLRGELMSFYVEPASAVSGSRLSELPFPAESAAVLVVRGDALIAPKGGTELLPGDHVYVFCRPEDSPLVHLLFGREEGE